MTQVSSTAECKALLETSGITGWKRTHKRKFHGMTVRSFQANDNDHVATVVSTDADELLAYSVQTPVPLHHVHRQVPIVVPSNYSFVVGTEDMGDGPTTFILTQPTAVGMEYGTIAPDLEVNADRNSFPNMIADIAEMEGIFSATNNATEADVFLAMVKHGFHWMGLAEDND